MRALRAFISYSHDSGEHEQRVLALADQLRADGIEAWIDQYVQDPAEGWHAWMRSQVAQADRVLLIFTEAYARQFFGSEADGHGLGATFEGVLDAQALYQSGARNAEFRPVVFRQEDERFIPSELRRFNRYRVDTPEHYQNLLRWLHESPFVAPGPVGQKPDLPPKSAPELFPAETHRGTIRLSSLPPLGRLYGVPELPPRYLPREEELAKLKQKSLPAGDVVSTKAPARVIGVHGMGGIGKSVLAAGARS